MENQTSAELKYKIVSRGLATEESLSKRPLTMKEIRRMHPDTYLWHSLFNPAELDKALNAGSVQKAQEAQAMHDTALRLWHGGDARYFDPSMYSYLEEQTRWCADHPQYRADGYDGANTHAIATALVQNNLLPTYANVDQVFRRLALEGSLHLNPSAIGLGDETDLTGWDLKNAIRTKRGYERLLEPFTVPATHPGVVKFVDLRGSK